MGSRSVGRVLAALGLWVAGSAVACRADAATVTYDLAETSVWYDFPAGFDPYDSGSPLLAGSYLTLEFDADDVTVAASRLLIHDTFDYALSAFGSVAHLSTDLVATFSGGSGTRLPALIGILFEVSPEFEIEGTVTCESGDCEELGFGSGPISYDEWRALIGIEPIDPLPGAVWTLSGDQIGVARRSGGSIASWIVLGGRGVPEPSGAALVLAALVGLSLRRFA